jgi:C4-dicarboxylate transporter DctM subunit
MVLFSGYIAIWSLRNPDKVPPEQDRPRLLGEAARASALIPVLLLIAFVFLSMVTGWPRPPRRGLRRAGLAAHRLVGALADLADLLSQPDGHARTERMIMFILGRRGLPHGGHGLHRRSPRRPRNG